MTWQQIIGETTDLSQQQPAQVAALQTLYNQWQRIAVPATWQESLDETCRLSSSLATGMDST